MKTIKEKVLKMVAKQGIVTRKELQFIIFKAQGKKGKEATTYRCGYYGNTIKEWCNNELLENHERGFYRMGKMGKMFIKTPEKANLLIRVKRAESRAKSLSEYAQALRFELRKKSSQLRDIQYILNNNQ